MPRARAATLMLAGLVALAVFVIAGCSAGEPQPSGPPTPLTLTVTAGEGGSVAVSPEPGADGTHPSGTTVTLSATADKGYDFSGWAGLPDGATVTAGPAAATTTSGTETSAASFTLAAAATVTASFRVESIPYNLHTTGAITAAGSYALLSDPDDLTSTMEWRDRGYTNPPYGLLLHASDGTNASRASYYGAIAVGDRVDLWWGDRCQVRLQVTEVRADLAGTPPRKLFVVDHVATDPTGCASGTRQADAPQLVEFRWRQPPWRVAANGVRQFWEEPVPGPGRYYIDYISFEVPASMRISAGRYYQHGEWNFSIVDSESGASLHLNEAGEETKRRAGPQAGAGGASEHETNALLDQIVESIRIGRGP